MPDPEPCDADPDLTIYIYAEFYLVTVVNIKENLNHISFFDFTFSLKLKTFKKNLLKSKMF